MIDPSLLLARPDAISYDLQWSFLAYILYDGRRIGRLEQGTPGYVFMHLIVAHDNESHISYTNWVKNIGVASVADVISNPTWFTLKLMDLAQYRSRAGDKIAYLVDDPNNLSKACAGVPGEEEI